MSLRSTESSPLKGDGAPLVTFSLVSHLQDVVPEPMKASTTFPRWYRELLPDVPREPGQFPSGTAKRCMPMMDVLSAGYVIPLPVAVHVQTYDDEEGPQVGFSWRTGPTFIAVEGHSQAQVGNLRIMGGVHKWINPWKITTPPGYSCLFMSPANRPESPFECFSAVVDTDTYQNTINFPFYWKQFPFDKTLDPGEPMIQVIPFKREEFSHRVEVMTQEETDALGRAELRVRAQNHLYKRESHHKKVWQ